MDDRPGGMEVAVSGTATDEKMHALVVHPTDRAVLAAEGRLPSAVVPENSDYVVDYRALASALGAPLVALRWIAPTVHQVALRGHSHWRWVAPDDLIEHREVAELALRLRDEPDPLEPPWAHPQWLDGFEAWMGAGEVEQWQVTCISSVVRADGLWGKASLVPHFGAEPAVTEALHERFPGAVPAVVKGWHERGWSVLGDAGEQTETQHLAGLLRLGEMQRACAEDIPALLRAGVADRRLANLPDDVATIMNDALVQELVPEEDLDGVVEWVTSAAARLADLGPPDTLVHGDLHTGNVLERGGEPVLIDWSDAAISHPFFDLATWRRSEPEEAARDGAAYLGGWPGVPEESLRLATVLGNAHHAVSYTRLVNAVERPQRWHYEAAIPGFLKRFRESRAANDGS